MNTQKAWHALEKDVVYTACQTTPRGLSAQEVERFREKYGFNRLQQRPGKAWYLRFISHFHNSLIYIMMMASLITFFMGHFVDSAVIALAVILNTVIGYIQEGKAEKSMNAIRDMLAPKASVLREGKRAVIDAGEIVPGDIVMLEAGDKVPADLRLVHARVLRIDEAALTGESVPVEKEEDTIAADTPLAERKNMAFSGTFVTAGQGLGIAVETAMRTEIGHISKMLENITTLKTPLLRQMDVLAHRLTSIILAMAAVLFAFAYYVRSYDFPQALMTVVGFAVAIIPEGLPAVMTITLAIGVNRMAKRQVIIRRLPAVETLGAVSVICTDKTGTLTRNEMMVSQIILPEGSIDVSGDGYAPTGTFQQQGAVVAPRENAALQEICRASALCNDAAIYAAEGHWFVSGDPMEGALVCLGQKAAGYTAEETRSTYPRIDTIPFDAAHRFMATLHHDDTGSRAFLVVKGAPEQIIAMSSQVYKNEKNMPIAPDEWTAAIEKIAARGQRVLGIATKEVPIGTTTLSFDDVTSGLTMLGLVGLIDPPRAEAIEAVADCRRAGIRVVMITGDHATTALAIAQQLKLSDAPTVLSGHELDLMSDEELHNVARKLNVFARTSPAHKLRLVRALQRDGDVIAMTGDGVNDAPALKRADVGVAMGRKGTEVAKESAEIVLADDNFASIVAAVREGRTVYDNLRKVIAWTFPTNVGEVAAIVIAVMLGLALPLTPVQILWINMITSVGLGLVLAFEPTEPETMQRLPRKSNAALISHFMIWRIVFIASLFVVCTFGIYNYALSRGLPLEAAHTLVVNMIVVLEIFYLFSVRYVHGTSLTLRGAIGTKPVILGVSSIIMGQILFTYMPFMNNVFGTYPIYLADGLTVVAIGLLFFLVVEFEKRIWKRS